MINDDLMGFNRDLMGINGDHRHECWLKHVKTVIFWGAGVPIGFIQGPRRENHGKIMGGLSCNVYGRVYLQCCICFQLLGMFQYKM